MAVQWVCGGWTLGVGSGFVSSRFDDDLIGLIFPELRVLGCRRSAEGRGVGGRFWTSLFLSFVVAMRAAQGFLGFWFRGLCS